MTKKEFAKLKKICDKHKQIVSNVRYYNRMSNDEFDALPEHKRRWFDQQYGQALGMESVFAALGIDFDSVDD